MAKRKKIGKVVKKKRKLIELQRYENKVNSWDHNYCAEVPESSTDHAEWESASSTSTMEATAINDSDTSDTVLEELNDVDKEVHVRNLITPWK